ncbi:MAG: succinate dehydrogenase assembly factor 2 [Bauldia sp.]|uniref:FAD assembly factor SdhE n=1 Tax=Bauldia sp. TaxID=2575872 RepID=UPI001D7BEE8D|nr:succinate dehydrogenase assembly factor 2 [Bauldia sp.]MCB1497277.1 succinate dehydrogenase assembly factor 2 [Bauldia sp.]
MLGHERRAGQGSAQVFYWQVDIVEQVRAALDTRRKRLAFRAWHRGTRETDLILGRFADAHLASFSESEVAAFERLLDMPDPDILNWVTGAEPVPEECASPVLDRLVAFHNQVR